MSPAVPSVIRAAARRGAAPLVLGAALAALPASSALATPPVPTVTRTFRQVGCTTGTFTVPDGVTSVHVAAVGGAGVVGSLSGNAAGRGAIVEGDLAVSGGQMLSLCVGEAVGGVGGAAGAGGSTGSGGAGGGYSSVATTAVGEVVIAGGGGGTGGMAAGGAGGDAGLLALTGANGGGAGMSQPGRGASETAGGAGGTALAQAATFGRDGTRLTGGLGGNGDGGMFGGGGGGGGAGAFGGGGGAANTSGGAGAGGGGGASLCKAPVTGCDSAHANASAPSVTLTYAKPRAALTLTVSPDLLERGDYPQFVATFAQAPSSPATVDFAVDGTPVNGCTAVPVVADRASCRGPVPSVVGRYTASASFAGDADWDSAQATDTFEVALASVAISAPSLAFGDVLLGATAPSRSVTVVNDGQFRVWIGDAPVFAPPRGTGRSYAPQASPRGGVRLVGTDAVSFTLTGDTCTSARLDVGRSCTVEVAFTPTRTGAHAAAVQIATSAAGSPHLVSLTGSGVTTIEPDRRVITPRQPDPQPEQPKPAQPKPAALAPSARGRAAVTQSGGLTLPVTCPQGSVCSVSGTLTVASGAFASGARSAAAKQQLLVSFRGVTIRGTAVKSLRLRIPQRFVKAAQKAGKRTVRATLTITTRRAGQRTVVTRQQLTLTLPKAAKAPRPVAPARRPSFTG